MINRVWLKNGCAWYDSVICQGISSLDKMIKNDSDLEIILKKLSEVNSNLNPINHDDLIEDDSI